MVGEAADLDKQLQILNRTVRWSSRGLWIEADLRHVKEVIKALGLEGASPAPTPGAAAKEETRVEDNEGSTGPELGREETTMFRAVAARLNFLSQDQPDITFATVELCSKVSRPDAQDFELGVCSSGKLIQVLCTPLLTRIGRETDSQGSRSVEA